jgi:DNA helicase HerA-like ATPase
VRAVLSGVSVAGGLREVLARLDTRQQALILGHAVPMPVVVRTRDYDAALYEDLSGAQKKPKALYPEYFFGDQRGSDEPDRHAAHLPVRRQ